MKRTASTQRDRKSAVRVPRRRQRVTTYAGLSPEGRFLSENAKALEAYPGEVLLVSGYRLVAHSPDMAVILKVIKEQGVQAPMIYRVPMPGEAPWL